MRKLKLQVQMSVDGFIAGPGGEMDWMTWSWDDKLKEYVNRLHEPVDTILLGRKMADGFISHWSSINDPKDESYEFARLMVETPKVVFSKTMDQSPWANTVIAGGDISEEVDKLKKQDGQDMIVYGGASFDSSLIKEGLIDEYHLFINPAAIGKGMPIFRELAERQNLILNKATGFDCGIVVLNYGIKR